MQKKNIYSGVANKSDIAVVELDGNPSEIETGTELPTVLESLKYLFSYSDSVNKPIVVNLSLGEGNFINHACDGESIIDLAINELIDENPSGKIVVAAAGNLGLNEMHFEANIDYNDSANIRSTFTSTYNFSIWGEANTDFGIDFYIRTNETDTFFLISANTNEDKLLDTQIILNIDGKEINYDIILKSSNKHITNNRPNLHFKIYNEEKLQIDFTIFSYQNTTIHGWNNDRNKLYFYSDNVKNNSDYTISCPATAENVISVVGYFKVYDENFQEQDATVFSSKGPLTSGKIKPDITATGNILSALNGFITVGAIPVYDETTDGKHKFGYASGTSMSSPMVAGIVALMLEKKPDLTQKEAKEIIRITAINDQWTGNAKDNKNPTWGWGKINAQAIMKYLEETNINEELNMDLYVFPNPATDYINIIFDNPYSGNVRIDLVDAMGKTIATPINKYCDAGIQAISINDLDLHMGAYFLRMTTNKISQIKSFIVK